MDNQKLLAFNQDQVKHIQMVQRNVLNFCTELMNEVLKHDESKFSEEEYFAFIESRDSLRASKTGTDEDYQKHLKGQSIQHHITENPHHPEYWDKRDLLMPITQAIIMFFDWYSRSKQNGTSMEGFWDHNMNKLKKQDGARMVACCLRKHIEPDWKY